MLNTWTIRRPEHQEQRLEALAPLLQTFRDRRRLYDEPAEFPTENFKDLFTAGLLGATLPTEYGGEAFWWDNFTDFYDINARIAAADPATSQLYQIQAHAAGMVAFNGTQEQRDRLLPRILNEGLLIASAGSEAKPSSKGPEQRTAELQKTDSGWTLSCEKHFVSLGPGSDYFLIWTTMPGEGEWMDRQVFVLVPRDAPGITLVDEWDTIGMRATVSWAVKIKDFPVTEDDVIGEPGVWARDPRTFTLAYVSNYLGSARGALDFTAEYVKERPYLSNDINTRTHLAELSAALDSTFMSLNQCAVYWEAASSSGWDPAQVKYAEAQGQNLLHVSKYVALNTTQRVFDICGARAAFRDLPLDGFARDVRTFTLHTRDASTLQEIASNLLD